MNSLAKRRLDLFRPLLSNYLSGNWDNFWSDSWNWPDWDWPTTRITSDLNETDNSFIVKAEVPGSKETDINVEYNQNTLTITTETKKEEKSEGQSHFEERYYGRSTRSYYLPHINREEIVASLKDGVLTVTCPKITFAQDAKKQIPIKTE